MKISELIVQLLPLLHENGDVEVEADLRRQAHVYFDEEFNVVVIW